MDEFIPWGAVVADHGSHAPASGRARRLAAACQAHPDFDILEYRSCECSGIGRCDILVVRCTNHEIPNRNEIGIKVLETLALTVPINDHHAPEVRALRAAFPLVSHLNGVAAGEPNSLCLFSAEWNAARRTWTPQRFLARILWWLTETANGTLHPPDQPVERVYFDSGWDLVLPAGYGGQQPANTRLVMHAVERGRRTTVVAAYSADADVNRLKFVPICLRVERSHGLVDPLPGTLGRLVDQWVSAGFPIADILIDRLARLAGGGVVDARDQSVLLLLDIGVARIPGGAIERREPVAFLILQSVVSLAYAIGAVYRQGIMYFAPSERRATAATDAADDWRQIGLIAMDVKVGLTRQGARRQAGLPDEGADAERVLIGAGSLGSALAELWAREAWGRWTIVDPDHVQPHNLVRHRALYSDLGQYKVNVVKALVECVYSPGCASTEAIAASATVTDNETLTAALGTAELVVDVSTTLDVPRELSARTNAQRMVSAFMTPSGAASVILLEDKDRTVPLHCIEPQYYRQILRCAWGATHLVGHAGHIAVGAGCRDVALVMSPEIVELHSAILARQIRSLSALPDAALKVWIAADDGSVVAHCAPVRRVKSIQSLGWCVVLDDELVEQLCALRAEREPKETGGIIVGYTDHVARTIYVVDVLPAPTDSLEEQSGFVRGAEGLSALCQQVRNRTANIVDYVGEWHSHPPRHGASPSRDDLRLVKYLGDILARDGEPVLMLIIAEAEFSLCVCDADGATMCVSVAGLWRARRC